MLLALLLAATTPSAPVHEHFDAHEKAELVPVLVEAIRFPTVAGDEAARKAQAAWLQKKAASLGFTFREGVPSRPGTVVEIELPATVKPPRAPVLGLMVHGDVVTVEGKWSFPPFEAQVIDGHVQGRGAVDDKGPLAQALLAMKALKESGVPRTHTVRLLVGSDEESGSSDVGLYLKERKAPDLTLILDSELPVVVGEMAWNALTVSVDPVVTGPVPDGKMRPVSLRAGTSASIVPDRAELVVKSPDGERMHAFERWLAMRKTAPGTDVSTSMATSGELHVIVTGRAAHSGVNIDGGRNALVALANLVGDWLEPSGIAILLEVARRAGEDTHGKSLGLHEVSPGWKPYNVNPGVVEPDEDDPKRLALVVNIRRPPPWTGEKLRAHVEGVVKGWLGPRAQSVKLDGWYKGEPLVFDPNGKLVRRLLAATKRATGVDMKPAISGGGTYARRLPNAIAFGMWFPGKPYPGHDVDERVAIADLEKGAHVLIEALVDLACHEPLVDPLAPGAEPERR